MILNMQNQLVKTIGYAEVEQDKFVRLVKHSFLPLIIFLLFFGVLLCGLLFGFSGDTQKPNFNEVNGNPIHQSENYENNNNGQSENHYLYVWGEKTVDEKHKTVALINHPDNDVFLCYDIYDKENNLLDTTNYFRPNTQIDYDFYDLFGGKKGSYELTLFIKVADVETKEPLCTKTMPVVINIK